MTVIRHDRGMLDADHTDAQQQGTRLLWFLGVAFVMSVLMPILLVAPRGTSRAPSSTEIESARILADTI